MDKERIEIEFYCDNNSLKKTLDSLKKILKDFDDEIEHNFNNFSEKIKKIEKTEKTEKKNTPEYYKLNIKGVEFDVNDLLEAIDNKLKDNDVKCSKLEFNYFFQALKYLLRCYFKENKILDLKKCLSEIQQIIGTK